MLMLFLNNNNDNSNNDDDDNVNDNDQPYLVRVSLDSKADKPVALNPGSNWNLVFVEGGKPENPEKNLRSRDENQQQTQLTCDTGSGNRTWATEWEASALTTAPSLHPQQVVKCTLKDSQVKIVESRPEQP